MNCNLSKANVGYTSAGLEKLAFDFSCLSLQTLGPQKLFLCPLFRVVFPRTVTSLEIQKCKSNFYVHLFHIFFFFFILGWAFYFSLPNFANLYELKVEKRFRFSSHLFIFLFVWLETFIFVYNTHIYKWNLWFSKSTFPLSLAIFSFILPLHYSYSIIYCYNNGYYKCELSILHSFSFNVSSVNRLSS